MSFRVVDDRVVRGAKLAGDVPEPILIGGLRIATLENEQQMVAMVLEERNKIKCFAV